MGLPAPMKVALAFFIILMIAGGFWLFDWKAKDEAIQNLNTEIIAEKDKYAGIQQKLAQRSVEEERYRKLQADLQAVIQEQLTPESESEFVPSYIADIERLVEQQRARMGDPSFIITSLTPESSAKKNDGIPVLAGYPTRGFQMQLTGRYSTVIDFLRQLGALKLKRLVTVSNIKLSGGVGQGKDVNYAESPALNVTLPITVYLRSGGEK